LKHALVTGGDGQLGQALGALAWPAGWTATPMSRRELDLEDASTIAAAMARRPWSAVINAAAYTAVDRAESEPARAWAVNAIGPALLAERCRAAGIPLVQVSTDYVFAGTTSGARHPDDVTGPLGVYGASKLGGELAVRTAGVRHAIVRTAWVFGATGSNFVRTMLRLAREREVVRVVGDQVGSPTAAADLAAAVAQVAIRMVDSPLLPSGVHHFANAGATNWASFAREIFARSAALGGPSARIETIATADFPTPARRPANSLLDTGTLTETFGVAPRAWQDALQDVLVTLLADPAPAARAG
jgi:dTDP-4-dehydrorhamnose reductase